MKETRCGECGAVLRDRLDACPLCGTAGAPVAEVKVVEVAPDDYQARVRALRAELRKLREGGAEAV